MREQAEAVLCAAHVYKPARDAYQRVLNREHYAQRVAMRAFYRRLLPTRTRVFDVGANHGRMTEVFLELGHRVVAIEPNPMLAVRVARRYPRATLVRTAVGSREGSAELRLGAHDGHSTLADWDAPDARYVGTVTTEVTTLDALIAEHGQPGFVKLDIEGYEDEALAGLTTRVPLSFEYQCAATGVAERSFALLAALDYREFAVSRGEAHADLAWGGREIALRRVAEHAAADGRSYGDVYAR